jgi:hypothetical protein
VSEDRFPRRDWSARWAALESLASDEERELSWRRQGEEWLRDVVAVLGNGFHLHDVGGFWVVSDRDPRDLKFIGRILQNARRRILASLEGIAADPLFAQLAVLWLENEDQYYEYIAHYYPESGEFSVSGGMFLGNDYPHFVFPHYDDVRELEHVMSHELTHAMVNHLSLPLWLNEGMAVTMEESIAGPVRGGRTIPQVLDEHPEFWNADTIQEFWRGDSFARPDEGNKLSYALAQLITLNLGHDYPRFRDFVLTASVEDSGAAAVRETFEIELGDLVGAVFGEGDWAPRPEAWAISRDPAL